MRNIITLIGLLVSFSLLGQNQTKTIDSITKPTITNLKESQWQAILITKNKKDIAGLRKLGEVSANSAISSRDRKKAVESSTIKLQQKAAVQNATIVLITREKFYAGYGDDAPAYYVEGTCYGRNETENNSKNSKSKK